MYPTVLPQSELLSKLQDAANVAKKSWALRETAEKRQSSTSSSSGSGSDSGTAVSCKREAAEPRPRSSDRRPKGDRRPISRSQSAQPQRSHRNSRMAQASLREETADAQTLMDLEGDVSDLFDSRGARRPTRARSSAPALEQPEQRKRRGTASKDDFKTIQTDATDTRKRPNAMSFLDLDSPDITEEDIRRVVETSGEWSPRSASSSSSSNDSAGQRSTADTDATTPEHSINGDNQPPATSDQDQTAQLDAKENVDRYGTPEMTRGPMKHPHIPPKELQPRIAAPGQGHAKHLPRAEKLPMSGYELLAAKLSSSENTRPRRRGSMRSAHADDGEPPIKPIYRRFEALNHRLLLHLQDELSELEEQLHRLDTTDTQTRRLANCILPASRRAEFMAGGELQWHKTDILGKIGFKLGHYNQVLTSFTDTQALPSASLSDIETYRTYLATRNPIAEIETRFLDPTDDLVCLSSAKTSRRSSSSSSSSTSSPALSEDMLTPMPLKTTFVGFSPSPPDTGTNTNTNSSSPSRKQSVSSPHQQIPLDLAQPALYPTTTLTPTTNLTLLAALAVVAPILTFGFITDFVFRMAVVLVVGLVVSALRTRMDDGVEEGGIPAQGRARGEAATSTRDILVLVGVYGGVMGFLAVVV
ncbi:hypothetical protein B0T14DRAFT_339562 [Immersiella caudata]|uniref:DUF6594 domain-containing protein n=1 Tax=Immersiella caudata TaxID=314043 RepID=A0AA39W4M6_9PEZI|nr:hypothetical protein B0T14DRAFT_339562 [Immersiella caudata]